MVELRELRVSKFYLVYMICISSCLVSLLVKNVITHSPCVGLYLDPVMILNFVFGGAND